MPVAWRAARLNSHDEELHLLELVLEQWTTPRIQVASSAQATWTCWSASFASGRSGRGVTLSTAALAELDAATEPERAAELFGLRGRLRQRIDGGGTQDLEQALSLLPPWSSPAVRSRLLSALALVGIGAHRHNDSRRHATDALMLADGLEDDGLRVFG